MSEREEQIINAIAELTSLVKALDARLDVIESFMEVQ